MIPFDILEISELFAYLHWSRVALADLLRELLVPDSVARVSDRHAIDQNLCERNATCELLTLEVPNGALKP